MRRWSNGAAAFLSAALCFLVNFSPGSAGCEKDYFQCADGSCVPVAFRCDGEDDCGDLSDEMSCQDFDHGPLECGDEEWKCLDGQMCVLRAWLCDGHPDCEDRSDEQLGCKIKDCMDGFLCENHHCIISNFRCDGADDCGDGSDERGCGARNVSHTACTLDNSLFQCADTVHCLDLGVVCNGADNCLDGSDEGPACNDSKAECERSDCNGTCHALPSGHVCTCGSGFVLQAGKYCIDIDECEEYGVCDQRCFNTPGSYSCKCLSGYQLHENEHRCVAEGGEPLLLFATKQDIRGLYLQSRVHHKVAENLDHAVGVAYDGNFVYWTNMKDQEEAIYRSLDDGSKPELIVSAGLGQPEDLAVDWVTGNIYFTDVEMKHIGVCSHDGSACAVVLTGMHQVKSLVLVFAEGFMFWSDWGDTPMIGKAGMDGAKATVFVETDIHWPNGLALDYPNYRLYWIDAKLLKIETIRLDGRDRRVVLQGALKHPYSIAVFEDRLYWSDWVDREIESCNKFTGKDREVIVKMKKHPIYNLHVYHPALHPSELSNPCSRARCSHLCLLSTGLTCSCACPEDKELGPDKHTCRDLYKKEMVVVAAGHVLYFVEHQILGKQQISKLEIHQITKIGQMVHNSLADTLIVSSHIDGKLFSVNLKTGKATTLVSNIGKIEGLAFDHLGNNLYWCDGDRATLEVMNLGNHFRTTILKQEGVEVPVAVAVVPEEGIMFVAFRSDNTISIDRMHMDGKGERTHAIHGLKGMYLAMTYDEELNRIFWADPWAGAIESTAVDATDRHQYLTDLYAPSQVATLGTDIFWTNFHLPRLYWGNKFDGNMKTKRLEFDIPSEVEVMTLAAVRGQKSPRAHICSVDNGGCSHICLLALKLAVCACPSGMLLDHDGRTCSTPVHCQKTEIKCQQDNLCIPLKLRCNRQKDCPSGEDEENCVLCAEEEFQCHNKDCIALGLRCNNQFDCSDRSDEFDCDENMMECSNERLFRCGSGECISSRYVCDNSVDCQDSSDEATCENATCLQEEFRCTSGLCIPKSWQCDNDYDCPDQSDEHDMCVSPTCGPDDFKCHNGHCIAKSLTCNHINECGDNSDELKCRVGHDRNVCPEDHFRCKFNTSICLKNSARCNGKPDCPNGEDERDCGCLAEEFKCDNGKCISSSWKCDGSNDCGDNSDESTLMCQSNARGNASKPEGPCNEFSCVTGECISLQSVCNGVPDCPDASDEGGNCDDSCDSTAPCSQLCTATPSGPRCGCHAGYELVGGAACMDVDECSHIPRPCAQICLNLPGSFECSCVEEFVLRHDRRSCKATGDPMSFVFSTRMQIRRLNQRSTNLEVIVTTPGLEVTGLDVNARTKEYYWSTQLTGAIHKKIAGGTQHSLGNVGMPAKLAVDWVSSNIYVIDAGRTHKIKVCNFARRNCAAVISMEKNVKLTTLAVDPSTGLLFWAESTWGLSNLPVGGIYSSDMAGSGRKKLADGSLSLVSGLALDSIYRTLFWIDEKLQVLESVNYDGDHRRMILDREVVRPLGLALYESTLYWLSAETDAISSYSLYSASGRVEKTQIHAIDAQLFTIMQTSRQQHAVNLCEHYNCTHLCVVAPGGPKCVCPDSKVVGADEVCTGKDRTLSLGVPEAGLPASESSSSTAVAVLVVLFVVAVLLALFYVYQRRVGADGKFDWRISFQNKAFGMSKLDSTPGKSRLQPGQHEYENPLEESLASKLTIMGPDGQRRQPVVLRLSKDDRGNFEDSDGESPSDSMTARLIP
ncbi:vitellogenin receptor isoform X2 [Bacillus rossius redtenbacheri]|uniref:vitellogenin receptor isoform X2 n=1 Tax=Bacillus rossius redtenbacheri TaxID=93214 RepID=UPI002FDD7592